MLSSVNFVFALISLQKYCARADISWVSSHGCQLMLQVYKNYLYNIIAASNLLDFGDF